MSAIGLTRNERMAELLEQLGGDRQADVVETILRELDQDSIFDLARRTLANELQKIISQQAREAALAPISVGRMTAGRPVAQPARVLDEFAERAFAHAVDVDPGERLSRRAAFLTYGFQIRGYGYVEWGLATLAEHEMRLDQLKKLYGGILESATLHVRAIYEIQAAGVDTLNEVAALRHANEKAIAS